jgi:hypothetical protein
MPILIANPPLETYAYLRYPLLQILDFRLYFVVMVVVEYITSSLFGLLTTDWLVAIIFSNVGETVTFNNILLNS